MINRLDSKKHHWWLYVLRLENGKWYVGITTKAPEIRFREHLEGTKSAYWTAKHKPIEVVYQEDLGCTTKLKAERRENKYTRELMKQRGLNDVRGGDLTSTEEYIQRFGYIFDKDGWYAVTVVVFLLLVITYLLIDKIFL